MSNLEKNTQLLTYNQVKSIVDFMAKHPELTSGILHCLEDKTYSKKILEEITKTLNSGRENSKSSETWIKYWNDIRKKVVSKTQAIIKGKLVPRDSKSLTKLEKQALALLGQKLEKESAKPKLCSQDTLPSEVMLECYQEGSSSQDVYVVHSRRDSLNASSLGGGKSGEESDDERDMSTKGRHHITLKEIEKKLVEADLLRARAEEKRVRADMKKAEVSAAQTEALCKLAQATTEQAEAVQRIANFLEQCNKKDLETMRLGRGA